VRGRWAQRCHCARTSVGRTEAAAIDLRAGHVAALAGLVFRAGVLAITFLAVGLRAGDLVALALLAGALAGARFATVLLADFFAADFFVALAPAICRCLPRQPRGVASGDASRKALVR
jgi:hypothetical protein